MSLKLICQSVPRAGTEAVFPAGQVLQEMLLAKPVQYKICKKKRRRPRDIFLQISDLARFVRRVSCKIRKISDMQEIAGESCDSGRVTTILCGRGYAQFCGRRARTNLHKSRRIVYIINANAAPRDSNAAPASALNTPTTGTRGVYAIHYRFFQRSQQHCLGNTDADPPDRHRYLSFC